jgi:hypothetical protein
MEEIKVDHINPTLEVVIDNINDIKEPIEVLNNKSIELVEVVKQDIEVLNNKAVEVAKQDVEVVKNHLETIKEEVVKEDDDDKLIQHISEQLFSKQTAVKIAGAYDIIIMIMELVETIKLMSTKLSKKDIVIRVLERIANGVDGVKGTNDDIISQQTMTTIKILLDNSLAEKFIDAIVNATKKKIKLNKPKFCFCF